MNYTKYHCGSEWMPNWLRRVFSIRFNESCELHDIELDDEEVSRLDADINFYRRMLIQAQGSFFWKQTALAYFVIVRLLGPISMAITKWLQKYKER